MSKVCFLNQYDPAVIADNVDDFIHKHDRTFIELHSGGVAYIYSRTEDGIRLALKTGKYSYWDYKREPAPFNRILRERCLFNFNNSLFLCTNNPERKYRTGFCASTVNIYNVFGNHAQNLDSGLVDGMLTTKYNTLQEALKSPYPSAVSSKWAVLKAKHKEEYLNVLAYEFTPVGILKEGKITIANELFEEEVRDLLRELAPDFTIKIKQYTKTQD